MSGQPYKCNRKEAEREVGISGRRSDHMQRTRVAAVGVIVALFALAQRLGGYENKPVAVSLALVAAFAFAWLIGLWIRDRFTRAMNRNQAQDADPNSGGKASQVVINAPGGIGISGGTVTSPTVNNFGLRQHGSPPRKSVKKSTDSLDLQARAIGLNQSHESS
jgi:hypothetical protein